MGVFVVSLQLGYSRAATDADLEPGYASSADLTICLPKFLPCNSRRNASGIHSLASSRSLKRILPAKLPFCETSDPPHLVCQPLRGLFGWGAAASTYPNIRFAIALGLLATAPTLAVGKSANMTGQNQNISGPAMHLAQSAKTHAMSDTGGAKRRKSVLQGRTEQ